MSQIIHYSSILDYISSIINEPHYINIAKTILNKTAHIPLVTTIARGAGYCSYHARLCEGIGIKRLSSQSMDRVAGHGSSIHKILGLSSFYLFSNHDYQQTNEYIERSINKLREEEDFLINENDRNLASDLLSNLVSRLDQLVNILGINRAGLKPIIEQSFIDYELHMRGIPDLILEDINEKKAIVIEWKTSTESIADYERAQVICYALLEAKRLFRDAPKNEIIEAVTGKRNGDNIIDIKVLPVIIRPRGKRGLLSLEPHPVLKNDHTDSDWIEFTNLVKNCCIEAEHLTILLTDQFYISGQRPEETSCFIPEFNREVNVLRLTPRQLPRGDYQNHSRWPCVTSNNKPFCTMSEPCTFYFGQGYGEADDYDKVMWKIRFSIYRQKEEDLLIYKAIYDSFKYFGKKRIMEKLREGYTLRYGDPNPISFKGSRSSIKLVTTRYEGKRTKTKQRIFRYDLLDRIEAEEGTNTLIGYRKRRDYEINNNIVRVINEGKSVFITLLDSDNPLLSINTFGRIDNVEIENNNIKYEIGIPSKVLKYNTLLFRLYIDNMHKLLRDLSGSAPILIFECNVDLTNMELNIVDRLQRCLEQEGKSEERSLLQREIYNVKEETENVLDPDSHSLREIIGKGAIREKTNIEGKR